MSSLEVKGDSWAEPEDLPEQKFEVLAMKPEMLPEGFRDWLGDVCERMCVPLDYGGAAVMTAAGALLAPKLNMCPKQKDDGWIVVPTLWSNLIGPAGAKKTPTLIEVTRPLRKFEEKALNAYRGAVTEREFQDLTAGVSRGDLERRIKEAAKREPAKDGEAPQKGETLEQLRALFIENAERRTPITCRRYVVNDATPAKLGEILSENPNGVVVLRDELAGLLSMMEAQGHENERQFFIEAWNGRQGYTFDRIGRGTVRIPRVILTVMGCMTPSTLQAHLNATFNNKKDDGLMQRFQLGVFPDQIPWKRVDRTSNASAFDEAMSIFTKLDELKTDKGFKIIDGVPIIRFDAKAQKLFNAWLDKLEGRLRDPNPDDHPVLQSHLAKFSSLMCSLALIFYVVERIKAGQPIKAIDKNATEMAVEWCNYLESHARRIYGGLARSDEVAAKLLSSRILKGRLSTDEYKDGFTAKDVYGNHWSGLDRETVEMAVQLLEDCNWIASKPVERPKTGRPPLTTYVINPKVFKKRN